MFFPALFQLGGIPGVLLFFLFRNKSVSIVPLCFWLFMLYQVGSTNQPACAKLVTYSVVVVVVVVLLLLVPTPPPVLPCAQSEETASRKPWPALTRVQVIRCQINMEILHWRTNFHQKYKTTSNYSCLPHPINTYKKLIKNISNIYIVIILPAPSHQATHLV